MYRLSTEQRARQGQRLRGVDLRLVVGFLKTCLAFIAQNPEGPLPFIIEGHRSKATQAKYFAQGRTTPGPIITYKEPGTSKHEARPSLAIDVGFLDDKGQPVYDEHNYQQFYELWQEHSTAIIWGGNFQKFKDRPHFEVKPI